MSGDPDPLYVRARTALLDTAQALGAHLDAIVLVGAQAVYLHAGDADLAVAEYTTDADFTIGPAELADSPLIADLMAAGGFTPREHPGGWLSADGIYVDLMVPEALAGPGGRGARLGVHGKRVARRAKGLEAALVDRDTHTIGALDTDDDRTVTMHVAGPGALLVAKVHKISERTRADDRVRDKDALDVLRLVQAIETTDLADRLHRLGQHDLSAPVTREAIADLPRLFGTKDSVGTAMAIRAAGPLAEPAVIAASITTLIGDLLVALERTDG
jgi:hypothetical protein